MLTLSRRSILQAGSLILAGQYARPTWAQDAEQPKFEAPPTFEPMALFLTWQQDPTTTMTIQWVGSEADGKDRPIWYRAVGDNLWQSQQHTARPYPQSGRWIFRSELTGLKPDQDYMFRVGLDSAEERFHTMPAKATNTIHFVSGGDSGIGEHAVESNKVAASQSPMFVVMGGDLAYENSRNPGVFLQFLKNYSRDVRDAEGRLIPLLACIGNHEVDGGYNKGRDKAEFFYACFDGLFKDTGYASLDFGDYMSLVLLDTNHTSPIAGDQTDWLEKTLKEREECPTVFVFNHVPAYPSHRDFDETGDDGDSGYANRKYWCPLFERYNVDAVFEHHDHTFKRTHPMLGGLKDPNGIVYLGDGSWGKIRRPVPLESRPYLAAVDESYHLSVHRIEGEDRHHVALSDTGRVVDVCSTRKRPRLGG